MIPAAVVTSIVGPLGVLGITGEVDIIETIAKAGPSAILVWGIVLLLTGRLVPGKEHSRVLAERDRFLELALKNATVASRAIQIASSAPVADGVGE